MDISRLMSESPRLWHDQVTYSVTEKDLFDVPSAQVDTAMVLAAGLGQRMRPLTDNRPKPLVEFCGKALIDHVLDRLAAAGITRAVVNGHYLIEQLFAHVSARTNAPQIILSDEREERLDTGGGIARALPHLGTTPFLTHNSDSVWVEASETQNLARLLHAWDETKMDCLMLLADPARALGYDGRGDFVYQDRQTPLRRCTDADHSASVFAGVSIVHPHLFADAPQGAFSMNAVWDQALSKQRVFGLMLDGTWMHIGTPEALNAAEKWIADGNAKHL